MKTPKQRILLLAVLGGLSGPGMGANDNSVTCYMKYFMCCNDMRPLYYKCLTHSLDPKKTGGNKEVWVDVEGYSNSMYSRMTTSTVIKQYKSVLPYEFPCTYSGKGRDKWGNWYAASALRRWIQSVEGETEGPEGECSR